MPKVNPLIRWTFALCLASFPFDLLPLWTFRWQIPQVTTALFLLSTLLQPRLCYWSRVPGALWWFGVFFYTVLLGVALHGWVERMVLAQEFLLLLQAMLFFWAATNLLRHDDVARPVLWAFALACVAGAALPLVGIGRTAEAVWTGGERVTAFGQNPNYSAKLLATGLLVLAGLVYAHARGPARLRWLIGPALAVLGIAIIDTGSRGGLVSLTAGLLVFVLSRGRSAWTRVRNAAFALLAVLGLVFASLNSEVMRTRLVQTSETGSMAGREELFPALWQMFLEHPWTGWGFINNQYELIQRVPDPRRIKRDSHNLALELLTTTGLIGAVPFFAGLGICVAAGWRARRGVQGITPLALLAVHLVGALSGNPLSNKLFWLVLAYAVAAAPDRPASATAAALARPRPPRPHFRQPLVRT